METGRYRQSRKLVSMTVPWQFQSSEKNRIDFQRMTMSSLEALYGENTSIVMEWKSDQNDSKNPYAKLDCYIDKQDDQ